MKLSTHTDYITSMTLNWFPWQPPTTDSLRQFSFKSLLHFSNLPTIVHMEMRLCAHVYSIFSMTTVNKKCPQALFPITTSSLLKLAHHTMHGGETLYTCVIKRFHDNHEQKMASGTFFPQLLLHFSNLQTMQYMEVKLGTHVYFCVSMTTMNKKLPQTLFLNSSLPKLANHSGEICTQVYLSISMMSSSLRHSISIHTICIFIGACPPLNDLH